MRPVAGVDIGGTKILGRVLDPVDPRRALAEHRVDTPHGADAIVEAVNGLLGALTGQAGRVGGIGVGVAGLVDHGGVLRFAPNLHGATDLDCGRALEREWSVPVAVDNDANCALVAEQALGAARRASDAVLVTLGTGIGAGLLLGGELVRGAAGFAGEPGHMVVDPNGPPCPCGRRGCWERYASGSGLGRLGRDAAEAGQADRVVALAGGGPEDVRGEHVTQAAQEGDAEAIDVLRQFAWWVALGIANLVNVLDVELVVVGGGLAQAGELLAGPTREAYTGLVLASGHRPPVAIELAQLGPEAGAIGAGLLAQRSVS